MVIITVFGVALGTPAAAQPRAAGDVDQPWAQGVSEDDQARAEELFLRANELFEGALFADAAEAYREAVEVWNHPAIHLNLAKTLILLQRPVDAYASLREAVRYPNAHDSEGQYRWAADSLERLKGQLVEIEVTCDADGAAVIIDGQELFVGPGRETAYFLPGEHIVIAEKRGYIAFPRRLILAPGAREEVAIELLSLTDARAVARPLPVWVPWTTLGAGVAIGVTGGLLRRQAGVNFARFDDDFGEVCGQGCFDMELPAELDELKSRASLQNRLGIGFLIAGGVMAAGGTAMVILNQPRRVFAERSFSVVPRVSAGGASVAARWRF